MARHKRLIEKYTGFPLFHTETNAFTFPLTHTFTKDFSGLDNLALDLQFATDKTLTARKGPTPVFTRASSATQVGATGLIEFAPENTLLRSEEFDAASWDQAGARNLTVAANNIASPTGSMTADKLTVGATTATYNVIQLTPTFISGSTYTVSCYFKANEVTRVSIWATTTATFGVDAFFDLTGSGSVTANAFGTASIQALSNGWYRCIITGTSTNTAATTLRIGPATTGNSRTYVGNSTDSFYVWGAQLEQHPTARTYIPTTTAVVYGARFDHDPITLACKGLLIEESRTNLMLQSQNFASATWSKSGGSISSATNTAPNGSTTSELFSEDSTTGTHRTFQTLSSTSGTAYSFSVFLKYAGRQQVFLETRAIGTNPFAVFNIQDGTIVTVSSGLTASIQAFPNGWYKCSIVGTATITGVSTNYLIGGYSGGSQSYTGLNGAAFYIYGSQLEVNSFPTSYIPTTTASVVRSADICSITGANFTSFYNQSEGTVYTESRPATVNGTTTTFGLSNGTANERWLNRFAQNEQVVITSAGVEANLDALNPVAETLYKVATAAKLNDIAMSINGLAVVTDTSQPMPVVDRAGIGNALGAVAGGGFVTIASLRYYKKRLPNAKLQTLTA